MVTDKGGVTMDLPIKIETKRLVLKGLNEPSFELAKNIYRVVDSTRDSLREWLPWVDKTHTPEDEYTHYLVEWCQKHWDNKEGFAYIIIDKETDGLIGCVDIFNISEKNKSAEIGYWLAQSATGKGYMKEAVLALEKEAFQQDINRIVIRNDTRNLPSAHVAKRCGYVLEGVMRQNRWSEFHQGLYDTNIWAKIKSDWMRQKE